MAVCGRSFFLCIIIPKLSDVLAANDGLSMRLASISDILFSYGLAVKASCRSMSACSVRKERTSCAKAWHRDERSTSAQIILLQPTTSNNILVPWPGTFEASRSVVRFAWTRAMPGWKSKAARRDWDLVLSLPREAYAVWRYAIKTQGVEGFTSFFDCIFCLSLSLTSFYNGDLICKGRSHDSHKPARPRLLAASL